MRELYIGTQKYTKVVVLDEPADGGACHWYEVRQAQVPEGQDPGLYAGVQFQKGPIKEHGVNGCHQEDLLAIVIDRLQCFQAGPYACPENGLALTLLQASMQALNLRTQKRVERGVEGTSEV